MNWLNFHYILKFFLVMLLCSSQVSAVNSENQPELKVKAAYLYNFARFIEWPKRLETPVEQPIVIAVAGRPATTLAYRKLLEKQTLDGRSIVVKDIDQNLKPSEVQILFIPKAYADQTALILNRFRGTDTLTVSEYNEFLIQGGMVSFYFEKKKIRFAIRSEAVDRAGLIISSQMLQYAKVVE